MSDRYLGQLAEKVDLPADADQALTWDSTEADDADATKRVAWSTIQAWVRSIVGAAGTQIVTALTSLSGDARLPATAVRDLPSGLGTGGPTLIGKGNVTASTSSSVDTGVDWPDPIDEDDLFVIAVHNLTSHSRSGSVHVTGSLVRDLTDVGTGNADPGASGSSQWISCDQGNSTDDEYFIGKTPGGDLVVATDANSSDDLRVSLWRLT